MFDILRFLIRFFILIPYYLFFYLTSFAMFNERINSWALFKLIRVLGQLREFLRIWFRIPLKDLTF